MKQYSLTRHLSAISMLGGMALGAATMFLADPDRGRRRRALAMDKLRKMRNTASKTGGSLNMAFRDLNNRSRGLMAQARSRLLGSSMSVDDRKLAERVRQCLGRAITHPRAIEVAAHQGSVTLSGPILASERLQLLEAVRKVQGVAHVEDLLEIHEKPDGMSSLQGTGMRASSFSARDSWRPATRAMAMAGGSALSMYGFYRRNPVGMLMAAAGMALMGRAAINQPFRRMAGLSGDPESILLQKTIHIEATPETVFDLWSKYENFPQFMSHVREVRDLGNGRSHWVVDGPAGSRIEWTAVLTECKPPEVLAWHTEEGSRVRNSGRIRLEPEGAGTRVSVHMWYSPPAGLIGHAVASLLGRDPKHEMNDDLMRMKQFIENGIPPRDAAAHRQAQTGAHLH